MVHGRQPLSLLNPFYARLVYSQRYFHDGQTGQMILAVLRPGNAHSNGYAFDILEGLLVDPIRQGYPDINILFRADAGYNSSRRYRLAHRKNFDDGVGMTSKAKLKEKIEERSHRIDHNHYKKGKKGLQMVSFNYRAASWKRQEKVCAKIESTGYGMSTRFIVTSLKGRSKGIDYGFYAKGGDTSENRIKEVKNMCFADRLFNHGFYANDFR